MKLGEAKIKNRQNKENLKLSLRGSVERASSTWTISAKAKNQIGLDQSVRLGLAEEVGSRIGRSWKAVGKIFPQGDIFWS